MDATIRSEPSDRCVPIEDYALIGNTRSAALVARDGSIDWWCVPRFDDPPIFGRLVGGDAAGWFSIGPDEPASTPRHAYRPDTATVVTTWEVNGGVLQLADNMPAEIQDRLLPSALLVRQITARQHAVRVRLHLAPRFGYGRRPPRRTRRCADGLVCERGDLALVVTSDGPRLEPDRTITFEVQPDRPITIVLSVSRRGPLVIVPPSVGADEVVRDEAGWRAWVAGIHAETHRDALVRSLLTLRLLTYSPSGAPVAAPTTSLPERVGGDRNWDYRYAWPRDASIGIAAFLAAGKPREAQAFFAWLLHASRLARPRLPVLFTLDGRPGPREAELHGWPGYANSKPVRIGNGASQQHQLDGYGWVVDAAWLLTRAGHSLYGEAWRAIAAFTDQVAATWFEPDSGIWEKRAEPAHHVHSKLMAWLALDRALRIAEVRRDRNARRSQRWIAARDMLADNVRTRGFDPEQQCYTAVYGSTDVDAAVLALPLLGIEPTNDARVMGTIDAIRLKLSAGGPLLYRYVPGTDGLVGGEGAFLPCSFWLVQALALTGRRFEAEALLAELLPLGGTLGLFAEEMDPQTGHHLGNYPQALTHAALVQAVLALAATATP